jgi:hypothetical protein
MMPAMEIMLTDEEAAALRDLLDGRFGEMSGEISHTDNPAFRRRLIEQRDLLRGVRNRLGEAEVAGSS